MKERENSAGTRGKQACTRGLAQTRQRPEEGVIQYWERRNTARKKPEKSLHNKPFPA